MLLVTTYLLTCATRTCVTLTPNPICYLRSPALWVAPHCSDVLMRELPICLLGCRRFGLWWLHNWLPLCSRLPTDIYHFLNCATRLLLAYPSVTTLMLLVLANPTVTTLVVVIVRPSSCF